MREGKSRGRRGEGGRERPEWGRGQREKEREKGDG
jgi:hypothetical protein